MTASRPDLRIEGAAPFASIVRTQEELLRRAEFAVHTAVVDRSVLSIGIGVSYEAPYVRRAALEGVPMIRRSSGGTGIVHLARDLVWSVVLPRTDARVGRDFVRAYDRFGAGLVAALAGHGADSHWVLSPGLSEEYCPLGSRGFVLDLGGGVVGAAAQHLSGTALLHHGTLSLRVDRELIARLFTFPDPSVLGRLTSLEEHELRQAPEQWAETVARALADDLVGR
jgi:lipoate-protein ligase A